MILLALLGVLPYTLAQNPLQQNATTRTNIGAAYEAEQHADDTFAFYNVPTNFSDSMRPGTLLSTEDATPMLNTTVPIGLTMSRIIYTTSDINGTVLPTTAYILWPYTPPDPQKGFDMVAWAHGTSGVFRQCAPSNYRNLQYHFMAPYTLALQGHAVVAPDYAGLGIDKLPSGQAFHHQWVTAPSQANDIGNAVIAARAAFPALLQPEGSFVVMGHSQGGKAAWGFAERQAVEPLEGYRGTVALAPPVKVIDQIERSIQNHSAVYSASTLSFQVKIIDAISTIFPTYNYSGLVMDAYDRWFGELARVQGCLPTDVLAFLDLSQDQLVKPGWTKDSLVQEWANISDVGRKRFAGPLLVIAGELDAAVDVESVRSTVNDICGRGAEGMGNQSLQFVEYSAVSHFSVIQASQQKWLGWIKDRLGDHAGSHLGCSTETVYGFRATANPAGTAPNFLLGWADPVASFWKYVL